MKLTFTLTILLFISTLHAQQTVYQVKGRFLTDPCGDTVILRGINKMVIWRWDTGDGLTSLAEISKTGANCVRMVWDYTGTADMLNTALTTCESLKMIPIIEQHDDNPGDPDNEMTSMPLYLAYWTKPEIMAVIKAHQSHILLNIVNELGTFNTTTKDFTDAYKSAIDAFRKAGFHAPLVIDGSGYGQNITMLEDAGPVLTPYDPDHNILYSVHLYWQYNYGDTDDEVTQTLQQSVDNNLPLIVGEFCKYQVNGDSGQAVSYKNIIAQCAAKKIGYIAWEWGPGNLGDNNKPVPWVGFTADGTMTTLNGWGYEVSISSPNGIQATSVKSNYLLNGACSSLPVDLLSFAAQLSGKTSALTWTTANEINNTGFNIQRSFDANSFTTIGFVATKAVNGNSNKHITYQFIDAEHSAPIIYYRLKQVDKDGRFTYSKTVAVTTTTTGIGVLYPNPAKSVINVQVAGQSTSRITFIVTDVSGKRLLTGQTILTGLMVVPVNINSLAAGTYLLTMRSANKTIGSSKFVKQ